MNEIAFGGKTKDKYAGGLVARVTTKDGVLTGGKWGLEHYRPVNDRELRKAMRFNDLQRALIEVPKRMLASVREELASLGPIRRELIGREAWLNLIVNTGLDNQLDNHFLGSGYTAAWFVGLKDTGTPVAADTMASHASWATITPYSDATDPAWTGGAVSGQSVDNSASKASFSCNATEDVFGAFLKDNNTKGGATGLLYSSGDFASSRSVINGDTLEVTATFTLADDGV